MTGRMRWSSASGMTWMGTVILMAMMVLLVASSTVVAFQGPVPIRRMVHHQHNQRRSSSSATTTTTTTALFLSDIPKEKPTTSNKNKKNDKDNNNPQDKDETEENNVWWNNFNFKLPPPPEDQLVLTGDLLSLFVYAFTDHFVSHDVASFLNAAGNSKDAASAYASVVGPDAVLPVPVWLDAAADHSDHVLHVLLSDQTVTTYSPILQPAGLAACALASAWLLSGWWHRAFLFRNTLDCQTDRALLVTAQTWLTTCILLFAGVALSNSFSYESQHYTGMAIWQTFTKGDVEYIWDSLSVLCMWRFLASSMLGSGGGD